MLKFFPLIVATTLLFVACDNSSSNPSSLQQDETSQNSVMDKLPFDTTGIKSQTISFLKPEEIFTAEGLRQHKEKYGEFWANYIILKFASKDYCKNTHIDNNGIITMEPGRDRYVQPSVFVVRDDSLMLAPSTYCRPSLSWGACDSTVFYLGKITVGNNDFYYNESEKQLIQLNDCRRKQGFTYRNFFFMVKRNIRRRLHVDYNRKQNQLLLRRYNYRRKVQCENNG